MKCKILNIKNSLIVKTPLMIDLEPFFYIKMDKECNKYRVSFNYDHLNKMYDIKFNFIRNLNKINIKNNCVFNIVNDKVNVNLNLIEEQHERYIIEKKEFNVKVLDSKITNSCHITKFIFKNKFTPTDITTIFVLRRLYDTDVNYSMLFSSYKYYKIDDFLETIL